MGRQQKNTSDYQDLASFFAGDLLWVAWNAFLAGLWGIACCRAMQRLSTKEVPLVSCFYDVSTGSCGKRLNSAAQET